MSLSHTSCQVMEGYKCDDILLTLNQRGRLNNEKEVILNAMHKQGRAAIRNTSGELKKISPALLCQMRNRYLENVQRMSTTGLVLHNLYIDLLCSVLDL